MKENLDGECKKERESTYHRRMQIANERIPITRPTENQEIYSIQQRTPVVKCKDEVTLHLSIYQQSIYPARGVCRQTRIILKKKETTKKELSCKVP